MNDKTPTLRFKTTEEEKDYEATFESEDFEKYFDEKLINYCLKAGEICNEALDSRYIHWFRFATWVEWNRRQGYRSGR